MCIYIYRKKNDHDEASDAEGQGGKKWKADIDPWAMLLTGIAIARACVFHVDVSKGLSSPLG